MKRTVEEQRAKKPSGPGMPEGDPSSGEVCSRLLMQTILSELASLIADAQEYQGEIRSPGRGAGEWLKSSLFPPKLPPWH